MICFLESFKMKKYNSTAINSPWFVYTDDNLKFKPKDIGFYHEDSCLVLDIKRDYDNEHTTKLY